MRQMIADMVIGSRISTPLVVTAATARKTKAGKDFLTLDLYDGVEGITGNYWDWGGVNIPALNSILDVTGQVTEYLGQKQLNISNIKTNTNLVLAEFAPRSNVDLSQAYKDCYELASDIKHDLLRHVCWEALERLKLEWLTAPGAKTIHHAYIGGTLVHTASVAKIAKAIASAMPQANVDLTTAGALLHDIGKLWTYEMDGLIVTMTPTGILQDHLYMGARYVEDLATSLSEGEDRELILLLVHIILSHHGHQEYGSVIPPMSMEAHIVHAADLLDADQEQLRMAASKAPGMFTEKIWTMDNKPQVTPRYTAMQMGED